MKVKELIEKLQSFDQNAEIMVNYDLHEFQVPNFELVTKDNQDYLSCCFEQAILGSYVHLAY